MLLICFAIFQSCSEDDIVGSNFNTDPIERNEFDN